MNATTALMANRDHIPGLGAKLRAARENSGLSQVEAGAASGVHHVSIAQYETDKRTPTLAVVMRLAAAYGVTVADLLPAPPEPDEKPKKKPKR